MFTILAVLFFLAWISNFKFKGDYVVEEVVIVLDKDRWHSDNINWYDLSTHDEY